MIHIKAPEGAKLRDTLTGKLYSEVICEERERNRYVVADSEADPTVDTLDGDTLKDRVDEREEELAAAKILLGGE